MARYPGNHTDSELLNVPRRLKTRPGAPETHLAYITDDEADLLKEYKPGTPHEGAEGIPNYDTWGIDSSGNVTGGSTAGGGGGWSGDTSGSQRDPDRNRGGGGGPQGGGGQHQNWEQIQADIKAEQKRKAEQKARALEAQKRVDEARRLRPEGKTQEQKQADMAKAIALAYNTQIIGGVSKQVSNLHNLTDAQLQFLIDSGFAASEASGVLGGVAGIETEVNKAKKRFAETGDRTHLERLGYSEEILNRMDPYEQLASGEWIKNTNYDPSLAYDPTGMLSWDDVESSRKYGADDSRNLYQAHTDLLSSSLSPDKYKTHMKNISAFGHPFPTAQGGVYGGWRGWPGGGGGGGGGGGDYLGPQSGYTPEQKSGFYTPQAEVIQGMINVHAAPTVFAKRGGIVSLLELR